MTLPSVVYLWDIWHVSSPHDSAICCVWLCHLLCISETYDMYAHLMTLPSIVYLWDLWQVCPPHDSAICCVSPGDIALRTQSSSSPLAMGRREPCWSTGAGNPHRCLQQHNDSCDAGWESEDSRDELRYLLSWFDTNTCCHKARETSSDIRADINRLDSRTSNAFPPLCIF